MCIFIFCSIVQRGTMAKETYQIKYLIVSMLIVSEG